MLPGKIEQDRPSHRAQPRRAWWSARLTPARAAVTAVAGATAIGGLAVAATLAGGPHGTPASDGATITADGTTDAVAERGWAASRSDLRQTPARARSATPSDAATATGARPAGTTTPPPAVRTPVSPSSPVDLTPPSATVPTSGSATATGQAGAGHAPADHGAGHGGGHGSGGHGRGGHSTPSLPGSPITVTTDPDELLSSIPSPTLATQSSTLLGAGR